jgi:transglutaminase-like putative cysteine protease
MKNPSHPAKMSRVHSGGFLAGFFEGFLPGAINRPPPFLLAAALLFWGWQSDYLLFAIPMALLLELPRFLKWRVDFSFSDYARVWDLCALLFLGAAIYIYSAEEMRLRAFLYTRWMPIIFFPMALAQTYGSEDRLYFSIFSWFLRSRRKGNHDGEGGLNVLYPYFCVTLLASSATNGNPLVFYAGICLLLGVALFFTRSRRLSPATWGFLLVLVIAQGYGTQIGLRELQSAVEGAVGRWASGFFKREGDLRESMTSIGQVGRLKMSGRILYRVEPLTKGPPPELLRQVTYSTFHWSTWKAHPSGFGEAPQETNEHWVFLPGETGERRARISGYLPEGKGVLPVPQGIASLTQLPVVKVETNDAATIRVSGGPDFVTFDAGYVPGKSLDDAPSSMDGRNGIHSDEIPALAKVAEELGLLGMATPAQKIEAVRRFFQNKFRYTIFQDTIMRGNYEKKITPLSVFLLRSHAGHCEYFATATVLLLRYAGVPARYATGFAVQESSGKEFIVRERHAHAWCLVFHDGVWRDFDTTPGNWEQAEKESATWWNSVKDQWTKIPFWISKWRWSRTNYRQYLIWLLIPLVGILVWRLAVTKRRRSSLEDGSSNGSQLSPGHDSEFFLVEQKLSGLGMPRGPGESVATWLRRLETQLSAMSDPLRGVMDLHYRYRFDPNGLSQMEREELRRSALALVNQIEQTKPGASTPA